MRGEFIDLGDVRLYYYAAGSRGAGEPIVLIHGFPASSHLWLDVVAKLPAGHRIVVVDLLGFGRSDTPLDSDYSIASHGRRVIGLLDALQIDRACIVGHGIGGVIGTWVALNRGDRVARLGVIDSPVGNRLWEIPLPALLFRLPPWAWLPIARVAIARAYDDRERGTRSAIMYLMPFATGDGPDVLRRHLLHLTRGEIAAIQARTDEIHIPMIRVKSAAGLCLPEEWPSEVAASIARLLAR